MLFANTHKFIHEARRLPPVIYDLQITYHKDQIHRKMISYGYICRLIPDTLPGKKALVKSDAEYEVVLIDATETPIERPKKTKEFLFRKKETAYAKDSAYCK